jgi:error-prone DNA polymerase
MKYTELQVTSNFSFLKGGSHPEEIVAQAAALGYDAVAICDHNTMAGIVRAHTAAKEHKIKLIIGCCLNLQDGRSLLAYPTDKASYARLCELLTLGNRRAPKGSCYLYKNDIIHYAAGMQFILLPQFQLNKQFEIDPAFEQDLIFYKTHLKEQLYLAATCAYQGQDQKRLYCIHQLCLQHNLPMIATNDVYYHHQERRILQDVLTCIREHTTIEQAGFLLHQNAERFLKPEQEMLRLYKQYPEAILNTQKLAGSCQFSLDSLTYIYPEEIAVPGQNPQETLTELTWKGAKERFNNNIPAKVIQSIKEELAFIAKKNYASYFLTVYDFVRFARSKNILCQGRGSAANSTVCYCLGITSVDPSKFRLLFARFMSDARDEPPDIDVDFEHERREEVIQYIFNRYGRDRAAIVATVTQVRSKGAIRDVGKVMGLSVDTINQLSKSLWEFTDEWLEEGKVSSLGFDPKDPLLRKVLDLASQYKGFPRQLGQHTGGFVITQDKLSHLCPIINARMEERTNIEWNKDDIEELRFLKVDVLALGMLTCIRKCFDLCQQHYHKHYTLANIPQDVAEVYEMISNADTIGVFQIESRAQMSMLPRLKPENFYDIVIQVAIVRPGPIQGGMVHPYIRRRQGQEDITYPSKELEEILGKTLGVPLFQEQAMEIAIVAAGFTPTEADGLRKAMATFKAKGKVSEWKTKFINGMLKNGYEQAFAERVFKQIEGFGSYGFPESHAVSFALLSYISSYLKCFYPDVFACALLNSLPMGFYQPAQIVIDARKHGVNILPIDINYSHWNHTLANRSGKCFSLRLGFRQINGMKSEDINLLIRCRHQHYTHVQELWCLSISVSTLELLADADAFNSIGLNRRQALWQIAALKEAPAGMFKQQYEIDHTHQHLPKMQLAAHVLQDYGTTALSIKAHPLSFIRPKLSSLYNVKAADLAQYGDGALVRIAGLILVRQRPGTATGVCFITIEDETGTANLVVFAPLFEKFRAVILQSKLLMAEGQLQIEGKVIHLIVHQLYNASDLLLDLATTSDNSHLTDNLPIDKKQSKEQIIQGNIFHNGRNFH